MSVSPWIDCSPQHEAWSAASCKSGRQKARHCSSEDLKRRFRDRMSLEQSVLGRLRASLATLLAKERLDYRCHEQALDTQRIEDEIARAAEIKTS